MNHPHPTRDAHAHLNPARFPEELSGAGAVLAVTVSLDGAAEALLPEGLREEVNELGRGSGF